MSCSPVWRMHSASNSLRQPSQPHRPPRGCAGDLRQLSTGRWMPRPLQVRAGGAGVDVGHEIVIARGAWCEVCSSPMALLLLLQTSHPGGHFVGRATRPLSDTTGHAGLAGDELDRDARHGCFSTPIPVMVPARPLSSGTGRAGGFQIGRQGRPAGLVPHPADPTVGARRCPGRPE
jgi:hypothetical protein